MPEKNLIAIMRDFELANNKEHEEIRENHIRLSKDVEKVDGTTTRIEKKMDKFIDAAEKKFAPMWVARVLTWAGGIIGGAVIVALLSLILIK